MRPWTDPIVWTHALFVLNAVLWAMVGAVDCAVILGLSTVASCAYHRHKEAGGFWMQADRILAVAALGVTVGRVLPYASWVDVSNGLVLLGAAFLAKLYAHRPGHYRTWHTLWHVMVCVGQIYLAALFQGATRLSLFG